MSLVGFEPTISAGERPQTYAIDRTATGTGTMIEYQLIFHYCVRLLHANTLLYNMDSFSLHCLNDVKVKYTGCPMRNVPDFGRVFLMLKYTDITQNTYIQSSTVMEIVAREV